LPRYLGTLFIILASVFFLYIKIGSNKIIFSHRAHTRLVVWCVFSCNNKVWQCLCVHQIFYQLVVREWAQPSLLSAMSGRVGGAFLLLTLGPLYMRGPRSSVQWNRAILLNERHKLDSWPLDRGSKTQNSAKSTLNLHVTNLEEKSIVWTQKFKIKIKIKKLKKWRAYDLKNRDASKGPRQGPTLRIQFASNESKLVARNLDRRPHLKWALVVILFLWIILIMLI
jgi:hypothetical protein